MSPRDERGPTGCLAHQPATAVSKAPALRARSDWRSDRPAGKVAHLRLEEEVSGRALGRSPAERAVKRQEQLTATGRGRTPGATRGPAGPRRRPRTRHGAAAAR